jgi:superfamily II DNA or RNA helicase
MGMITLEKHRTQIKYSSDDRSEIKYLEKNMRMFIPGAVYSEKYHSKVWDGYINFCNKQLSIFPVGVLEDAIEIFTRESIEYEIINRVPKYTPKIPFNSKLYEHQKEAIKIYFDNLHGIIKVPTRGGKTMMCAEMIRLLQADMKEFKVLFVVDSQLLLQQAVKDFADYLRIKKDKIGIIQAKIFSPKNITVASIQTLQSKILGGSKRLKGKEGKLSFEELREERKKVRMEKDGYINFFNSVDFLIIDECHEYTSSSRISVLKKFKNLSMDLSISASPFKSEDIVGNKNLQLNAGDIIYEIKDTVLKERGILAKDKIFLFDIDHNINRNIIATNYSEYHSKIITHNPLRNQILLNTIEILRKLKLKTLVLFSELKHGQYIQSVTGDLFISGSMKMTDRTAIMKAFLKKKGGVLLASDVFNKGITLPETQVLINASGGLEQSLITQKKGRVLGVKGEKDRAVIIDFIDNFSEYFYKHSLSRIEVYEKSVGMDNIEVFDTSDNEMYIDFREIISSWFEI